MTLTRIFAATTAFLALLPAPVQALEWRFINVPGIRPAFWQLLGNIISFLAATAVLFCTTMFLIGAYLLVFRAYDSNKIDEGKSIMKGSLIGLAVILGSYGILRTLIAILY